MRRRLMDRKIVELLIGGAGVNSISRALHVSKRRVRRLREQAKEYGYLTEESKKGLVELAPYPEALFPDSVDGRTLRLSQAYEMMEPHRGWIEERLRAGWHAVTVFEELPVSVSRSSFYRYLERFKLNRIGESTRRVVPEIVHRPGEALIVDWGKLRDAIDPDTGRKKTLWMFVGVLGFSRYLLVRLVWRFDVETTLKAIESMLRELGGIPFKITVDNPKCIALKASVYEPLLNPALERFASHYGVLFECLPPRDPQKKGKVERPIPYVRRLYEAHGEEWQGIEESQDYLNRKVAIANERKHATTLRRPRELFVEQEAKALRSLPPVAYEIEQFHEGRVRQDGHVRFQNKYYSLDENYVGKAVVVLGDLKQISIYYEGKLLEVHARITDPHQTKSTKLKHLKPWERSLQDDSVYRRRAARLGCSVEQMVVRLLKQGQGFIDTRKIWGILSLDKRYGAERINEACRRALELQSLSYRTVKHFLEVEEEVVALKRHSEAAPPPSSVKPAPKHVRPLSVYQEQLSLLMNEGGNHES